MFQTNVLNSDSEYANLEIILIIIYLYKIVIFHHGLQSFHIIVLTLTSI